MQSESKSALKMRLAQWQELQERFFISVSRLPRASQQEAYVKRKEAARRDRRRRKRAAAKKAAAAFANAAGGGGNGSGAEDGGGTVVGASFAGTNASRNTAVGAADEDDIGGGGAASSSDSSVNTLTGCEDREVLQVYPSLSRRDQKTLKNEDKLAVAAVAHSPDFLAAKIEFLEDMLFIYQHELEHQVKVNSSATYVKELQGDLNGAEDRVAYISTQLRKALDEVTAVKREKEQSIQALTYEFQLTMQRETERHEVAMRDFEHEKALLKAKIKSVEAEADDSVAVAKATSVTEVAAMRNRIENYIAQIQALEDTVQQEQKLRQQLETDLWDATQKLQSNAKVNDAVGDCTRKLQDIIAKELRNQRLVYGELAKIFSENSSGAWRWEGDPNGIVALSIRAQQHKRQQQMRGVGGGQRRQQQQQRQRRGADSLLSGNSVDVSFVDGGDGSDHNIDNDSFAEDADGGGGGPSTFLRSAAADEGDMDALYNDILRNLFPDELSLGSGAASSASVGAGHADGSGGLRTKSIAGGADKPSHLLHHHPAATTSSSLSATTALENFLRVSDKFNVIIAQYQGDLLHALTTGCGSLIKEKRDLKARLLDCYANAELQGRRGEEMARAFEAQKEAAGSDRDRALLLRDRLARQLRTDGGAHERRLTKNAECQTTLLGTAVVALLSGAAGMYGGAGVGGTASSGKDGGGASGGASAGAGLPTAPVVMPSALKGSNAEGRRGVTIQEAPRGT